MDALDMCGSVLYGVLICLSGRQPTHAPFHTCSLGPGSFPRCFDEQARCRSDVSCLLHHDKTSVSTPVPAWPGPLSSTSRRADTYRCPWTSARMVRKSGPRPG